MTTPTVPVLEQHMLARLRERLAQFEQNFNRPEMAARLAAMKGACDRAGLAPPSPPTARGRIGGVLVSAVMRCMFWLLPPLRAAFQLVAQVIEGQDAALQALRGIVAEQNAALAAFREEQSSALAASRAEQSAALAASREEQRAALAESSADIHQDLENKADNLRLAVLQRLTAAEGVVNVRLRAAEGVWEHQLAVKCNELRRESAGLRDQTAGPPPVPPDATGRVDRFHYGFQEAFRSTREDVRTRFSVYLDYLPGSGTVLDLGCGRGEWLELAGERGLSAYGVDQSELMVAKCRELGLRAEQSDVLSYLEKVPDESVACLTAFHVVEHLEVSQLLTFVMQAFRVLEPGGLAILETPNPENIAVGAHKFYQDITHKNPIPPPTLTFMLEHFGFSDTQVLRLHPHERPVARLPEIEELCFYFSGPQDYGVIARKPAAQPPT